VFDCPEAGCEFYIDGRGRPHYVNNPHCDAHAVGEHGKRWKPDRPPQGKFIAIVSSPGSTPVTIDENGEWWAWTAYAKWEWCPFGTPVPR
jgi:hypothetical protein